MLTAEQKTGFERGLKDVDEGKVHKHEDIKLKYGF
jgi:hypothetical protein